MNKVPAISASAKLWLIIGLALLLRLYHVTNPPADWHAFRQADTASVTREYVKHGINLLKPTYQDLSNIQSGKDNLDGYRMVEFPVINGLVALIIRVVPVLGVDLTSRLLAILASLGTLVFLYQFVKKISGQSTAELAALSFAVVPFAVYYSRVIMPEPFMLFFFMTSLWTFSQWLETKRWTLYIVSVISLMAALLLKPFVGFILPVYLVVAYVIQGKKGLLNPLVYLALGGSLVPLWWWRQWIEQYPSGIPANDWLFNSNQIRLRPAWFRWLFWERLTKLVLGYSGMLLLAANVLRWRTKEVLVYGTWWAGILIYFVVIATGNVQHDYYQVLMIPIVCISVARGLVCAQQYFQKFVAAKVVSSVLIAICVFGLFFATQHVQGYFNVNHWEYVEAGQAVNELTPATAKVIAPAFGDTHFLYQTNRTGWPIGFEIEDKINKGATHYITTSDDDEARALAAKYYTIKKTPKYLLLDLTKPL